MRNCKSIIINSQSQPAYFCKAFVVVAVLFILQVPFAVGAQYHKDEIVTSVAKRLNRLEGVSVNNAGVLQIAQSYFEALGDRALSSQDYFDAAKSSKGHKLSDISLVFGLMSLCLEGQSNEAYEKLEKYQPSLTYMDELPANTTEVLGFTYAWLINNTTVTVPCWFIKQFPEVFSNYTPYWGATRDAYFNACVPDNWQPESIPGYEDLLRAIRDAFNPGGCFQGSMVNARQKQVVELAGLIANRPDYYLENLPVAKRWRWLNYWQYIDPYNYRVVKRIHSAREILQPELILKLAEDGIAKHLATLVSKNFINAILSASLGARHYESCQEFFDDYNIHGATIFKNYEDSDCDKKILGSYLLYNKSIDDFTYYVNWLLDIEEFEVLYSLMNIAAADSSEALQKIIELNLPMPKKWGAFNKSPLLYAVQYNNHESYDLLKGIPEMNTETLGRNDDTWNECMVPNISSRNILTYAFENADKNLLLRIVDDFGIEYGNKQDSAGRRINSYLYKNQKLSLGDMENVLLRLGQNMPLAQYYLDHGHKKKATKFLKLAAAKNESDAMYELGVYAQEDNEYSSAVTLFIKTLELDPENQAAQLELSRIYMNGWGVQADEEKAFKMMKEVAEKENENWRLKAIACLNTGLYLLEGKGVKQSGEEGRDYLRRAIWADEKFIIDHLKRLAKQNTASATVIEQVLSE